MPSNILSCEFYVLYILQLQLKTARRYITDFRTQLKVKARIVLSHIIKLIINLNNINIFKNLLTLT